MPRVVAASAWVSPRVNNAEPCVRGRTSTSQLIGRTSVTPRPSRRRFCDTIIWRIAFFSTASIDRADVRLLLGELLASAVASTSACGLRDRGMPLLLGDEFHRLADTR